MSPRQVSPLAVGYEPAAMAERPYYVWIPRLANGELATIEAQTPNQARYIAYRVVREVRPDIHLFDIKVRRRRPERAS